MSFIAIPSNGRSERLLLHDANHTLSYMDADSLMATHLFIRKEESLDYVPVINKYGCKMINFNPKLEGRKDFGMPQVRDTIFDHAILNNIQKLIMMDDDLRLDVKPDSRTYIKMRSDKDDFSCMVNDLESYCCEKYPVVGITARQFSMDKKSIADENTRIIQVFCFYMPVIVRTGIRFLSFGHPFMTDYYVILSLLKLGYRNLCLNTYCRDDSAQTPGGCAVKRTAKKQSKCAVALYKMFPDVVSLYQKDTGTWKELRVNARISWRKAWKSV